MDHDGALVRLVGSDDSPVEGQDGRGVVWHAVVRPGCEVELGHPQRVLEAAGQLRGR